MIEGLVQAGIGVGLIVWAVVLVVQRLRTVRLPWSKAAEQAPLDDIRIVSDLSARLRNEGKSEAVAICLQLLAELLKPEAKA